MKEENRDKVNYNYLVGIVTILIALAVNTVPSRLDSINNIVDNLVTPHSGEKKVLPNEILFILKFVRMNHIRSISISPAIAKNRFIAQPLTESVYPTIVKDSAKIFISYNIETLPIDCCTLKIEKEIRIANCY